MISARGNPLISPSFPLSHLFTPLGTPSSSVAHSGILGCCCCCCIPHAELRAYNGSIPIPVRDISSPQWKSRIYNRETIRFDCDGCRRKEWSLTCHAPVGAAPPPPPLTTPPPTEGVVGDVTVVPSPSSLVERPR